MNTNLWQGQKVRLRAVEPGDWEVFPPSPNGGRGQGMGVSALEPISVSRQVVV